ncbi:MAG: hypothetical protein IJU79_02945 [Desulfovibrionaceae bacterium]|nr:hypothetical protein [Desulfovibrionaceae bacterium]
MPNTPRPKLTYHALDLTEYSDFETCLHIFLTGCENLEARVKEAILATVISGFRYNNWTFEHWISHVKLNTPGVNRLAYAAYFYFHSTHFDSPGRDIAKLVLDFCQTNLVDPWPEIYLNLKHKLGAFCSNETHVLSDVCVSDIRKKINWDLDLYCYEKSYRDMLLEKYGDFIRGKRRVEC